VNYIIKNFQLGLTLAFCLTTSVAFSQDILFSGGSGDITWFYNSTNNSWDTVFRQKPSSVASGLTNSYGNPPGGVGGATGNDSDWRFDSLTMQVANPQIRTFNGTNFWTAGAETPGTPDLGVRTRLRELDENNNAVAQFATPDNQLGFLLTLDWANSTRPTDGEFVLYRNVGGTDLVRYDTASGLLASEWPSWGHSHWIWGFSRPGDYNLVFNFQGVGGTYGPSSTGTVNLGFSVVPEPGSCLLMAGAGMILVTRRRRSPQPD
jgi:hypothetical protein